MAVWLMLTGATMRRWLNPDIMTRDELETIQAQAVLEFARNQITWCDGDEHAVIAAIIARALELATPQLSDRNRAAIFWSAD